MDLSEIEDLFVEFSGRADLADGTTVTALINAGQRVLDRLFGFPKDEASSFHEIAAASFYVLFSGARSVSEVWVADDEERSRLRKYSRRELREYYATPMSEVDQGTPTYYTPTNFRTTPDADHPVIDWFYGDKTEAGDGYGKGYEYNGIIYYPPADDDYVLEVIGKFYTSDLEDEEDESYWSVVHPMLLVWAALYNLEVSYRNTEGANDWMNAILREATRIDMDVVAEGIADVDKLEG